MAYSVTRLKGRAESICPQSVERLTGAHTEGEIKVLVELFQKLAGSKSSAFGAAP